jgi:hypothetical protein
MICYPLVRQVGHTVKAKWQESFAQRHQARKEKQITRVKNLNLKISFASFAALREITVLFSAFVLQLVRIRCCLGQDTLRPRV